MTHFSSAKVALALACLLSVSNVAPLSYAGSAVVSSKEAPPEALFAPVALEKPTLLAHNGCEGTGTSVIISGAAPLLNSNHHDGGEDWTGSLWGHLLLSMASQRDPELKKYAKRLKRLHGLTLASVVGISGLGLAQSIYSYNQLDNHSGVEEAHHEHAHGPVGSESKAPATMAVVGSAATLATLGVQATTNWITEKQAHKRMHELETQVGDVLTALENGANNDMVLPNLTLLVGERAGKEFLQLWRVANFLGNNS